MLKQALSTVVAVSALIAAGSVSAGETNPLHPGYATFAANIDFGAGKGAVEVAKNPLTPTFYQWNAATVQGGDVQIVMNNPLQPGFKRS